MAYSKFFEGDLGGVGKTLGIQKMFLEKCWSLQFPSVTVETNNPTSDETVS